LVPPRHPSSKAGVASPQLIHERFRWSIIFHAANYLAKRFKNWFSLEVERPPELAETDESLIRPELAAGQRAIAAVNCR